MAVVPMNRITLLGLKEEKTKLIKSLMDLGVVEISQEEPGEDISDKAYNLNVQSDLNKIDSQISSISKAISILGFYAPVKKALFSARKVLSENSYCQSLQKRDEMLNIANEITSCDDELNRLKSEEARLFGISNAIKPWLNLDIPLDMTNTRYTFCYTGSLAGSEDVNTIIEALNSEIPESTIILASSDSERHYVAVVGLKSVESDVINFLRSWGWNRIALRDVSGTARDVKRQIDKEYQEIKKLREVHLLRLKELAHNREVLEIISDSYQIERAEIEAKSRLISTEYAFLLKGWLPVEHSEKIKEHINNNFFCAVEIESPGEDEEFPVLLKNGPVVESISPVINMYGVPSSLEIDPSFITFPFYIFFFGLMLGDGGYGILIALFAGFVLKKFRLEDSTRKFIKLIFYCGLATILAGFLFGSWFGLASLTKTALWIVPTEKPELMMSYSILMGIIHMYVGMFMKALNLIRRGQVLDAIFDVGFMYIMLTGFVMALLPFAPGISVSSESGIVKTGNIVFITGMVLLLITGGRRSKNIFGRLFGGLPKLYDVVGFFSDCLSYTRILALGLASAIIGDIVNTLSMTMGNSIIIKLTVVPAVFLFGHLLNFALNALGAYVHSCRLQFLEFFGKFLEGGGEAFKPLKAKTEYIVVETELSRSLNP